MDRRKYLVRVVAVVVDVMICTAAVLLVGFALGLAGGPKVAAIGGTLVALAYSLVEVLRPQSFGKQFLDLKVGMLDGTEASRKVLARRWAMKHAPTILATLAIVTRLEFFDWLTFPAGFIVVLGFLMALHPDCQALHDWVNGTTVTKASRDLVQTNVPGPIPMPQPRPESKAA